MAYCKNCKKSFTAPECVENVVKCPVTGHLRHAETGRFCKNFDPQIRGDE